MENYDRLWNLTQPDVSLEDLKMDARMIWLLCSLLLTICWIIYITFYNSRMMGLIITRIINKWLLTNAFFKVGSLTISVLAGKIMFRDVVFVCFDYSVRIQDGYIIFRWWRSYVPKDISDDFSLSDTRLSITVNGFEVHMYNRSEVYNNLEKVFELNQSVLLPSENMSMEEINAMEDHVANYEVHRGNIKPTEVSKTSVAMKATTWRDLIPVIKIDICCGRLVAGNRLTPTTLTISVEEAHCIYSTKPAACHLDQFMHFVKAKIENAKVLFAPSLKYTGLADEPPRYMGEGFVVMMSNLVDIYFYMDEPGVIPEEPVHLTLANGDIVDPAPPVWGIDIKCGKGTDFSYGPWADRQRDQLFKFFFPPDWQEMKTTQNDTPGEIRQYQSFDISLCTLHEATIDVLFSKEKETNAMHVTIGAGSYVEVTIPWVVNDNGYQAIIYGQLLHMEATTSLQFRSLAECESLEYKISMSYPRRWNENQHWSVNLIGYKATAYIIYKHKLFFQDLIEDWSSKSRSDILTFVPYECKFSATLKEFEIITMTNEFNWIDCSSANQENHHLAFCGDLIDLSFVLPFNDFLPKTVKIKFWIHCEGIDLSMFLPEVSTSRPLVFALEKYSKVLTRSGSIVQASKLLTKKWRRICLRSTGWIDCWAVPIIVLSIQYIYHPIPPLGPDPQADITTPEKEEILLSPMRIPKHSKSPAVNIQGFDPEKLENDQITVELEVGSSILLAYGSVLRQFINLKENLFGEDQFFQDMEQSNAKSNMQSNLKDFILLKDQIFGKDIKTRSSPENNTINDKNKLFDPRAFRPLEVFVSVILHDIQAHLLKSCGINDLHCPTIYIERFGFEMKKNFLETKLQVLLSPSYILARDMVFRACKDKHLNRGHLLVSAIQVRGHAMFSNEGRSINEDSLEYAWLLDTQIGKASGKITLPQLFDILVALESFVFLAVDSENRMRSPKTTTPTSHQGNKPKSYMKNQCLSSEDIKYKMVRVSIDCLEIYLVESAIALQLKMSPIRISGCNLHGKNIKSGVSALVSRTSVRMFEKICNKKDETKCKEKHIRDKCNDCASNQSPNSTSAMSNETKNIVNSNNFHCPKNKRMGNKWKLRDQKSASFFENWLEVGYISSGPVIVESGLALSAEDSHSTQHDFLRKHDLKSKRLWFLWLKNKSISGKCGCRGGCEFFGNDAKKSRTFFEPNSKDVEDNFYTIRYEVLSRENDFGFGESILHENQLVFHTPPYSMKTIWFYCARDFDVQLKKSKEFLKNTDNKQDEHLRLSEDANLKNVNASKNIQRNDASAIQRTNSIEVPYQRLQHNYCLSVAKAKSKKRSSFKNCSNSEKKSPKTSTSDSKIRLTAAEYINEHHSQFSLGPSAHPCSLTGNIKQLQERPSCVNCRFHKSVHRTISLTSDNQSDVFFSAEEDTNNTSENSNTRLHSTEAFEKRKKFFSDLSLSTSKEETGLTGHKSDLEICRNQTKKTISVIETVLDEEKRVFHGLATPLRKQKSKDLPSSSTFKHSSSESLSASSSSFISAMSSQEDVSQINACVHTDKDSSILRAAYYKLLPKMSCYNWNQCSLPPEAENFSYSLFEENKDGGLIYIGNKNVPHFNFLSDSKKLCIISKNNDASTSKCSMGDSQKSHQWETDNGTSSEFHSFSSAEEAAILSDTTTKRFFVVKMKEQADMTITPLVFEALQRMVEVVTPSLSCMSVSTAVHIMHSFCAYDVKENNVLKRNASLDYESQVNLESCNAKHLQQPGSSFLSSVHVENITDKVQGLIRIPKINIIFLQSSMMKQNLSCMTMVALNIDHLMMKYYRQHSTKASISNVFTHPAASANESHKKGGIMRGTKAFLAHLSSHNHTSDVQSEPVIIETAEKQSEEFVVVTSLEKAQIQMLGLNNDRNILKGAATSVTAIPVHRSKCTFECAYEPYDYNATGLGNIMLECGMETVSASLIQRSNHGTLDSVQEVFENNSETKVSNNTTSGQSHIFPNEGILPKAESAWRLLSKKPPTPKIYKEKLGFITENITPDKDSSHKDYDKTKWNYSTQESANEIKKENDGTSLIVNVKSIWFNFAAPPSVSRSKESNANRLDWNLLSSASPTITAWMNPSNRLAIKFVALLQNLYNKNLAIAACLMAEALEVDKNQRKHIVKKSRYSPSYTLLSKTLHDDPSCQLCVIMLLHLIEDGSLNYEEFLTRFDVPPFNILRQGVVVLCMQWKNTLYNPILFDYQYRKRLKKPIHLFCSVENRSNDFNGNNKSDEKPYETSVESNDEGEDAILLRPDNFTQKGCRPALIDFERTTKLAESKDQDSTNMNLYRLSSSSSILQELQTSNAFMHKDEARFSHALTSTTPIISEFNDDHYEEKGRKTVSDARESSKSALKNDPSANQKDDLYFWTFKQEENLPVKTDTKSNHTIAARKDCDGLQDCVRLLDVHLIFEPLLTFLGVMPQQIINKYSSSDISTLENLGTNVSLLGTLNLVQVDIVVSEVGMKKQRRRTRNIDEFTDERSALLCQRVSCELLVSKNSEKVTTNKKLNATNVATMQLTRQKGTLVNCSLNIDFISQQINLPLLRLLRQISTMYYHFTNAQSNFQQNLEQRRHSNLAKADGYIDGGRARDEKYKSIHLFQDQCFPNDIKKPDVPKIVRGKSCSPVTLTTSNPSPIVKSRPQTFAQKLKSTGKSVKGKLGYSNLSDASPGRDISTAFPASSNFLSSLDSKKSVPGMNLSGFEAKNEQAIWKQKHQKLRALTPGAPNCWNTVFRLLEAQGTTWEQHTSQRHSMPTDEGEVPKIHMINKTGYSSSVTKNYADKSLIIFGIATIRKTQLLAMLSGLKLESEISTLNTSLAYSKKDRPQSLEYSLTGKIDRIMTVLVEGANPNQQTVVSISIGKSNVLFSCSAQRNKDKNCGSVFIGPIAAEIPQHPVELHSMMTRSSKKLSSTLQELGVGRAPTRSTKLSDELESPSTTNDDQDSNQQFFTKLNSCPPIKKGFLQPIIMQFHILLNSLSINAALLPSLQAQYKMSNVSSSGIIGIKTKFSVYLQSHSLSFTTKLLNAEANLPPEASLALPKVTMCAEYIPENGREELGIDGIILRRGGYVSALAEIGAFERCLTTDLLNHLVFVQKVFMKEINEVLQKIYGSEKPVPLWLDYPEQNSALTSLLLSVDIHVKRIQLTATTPCSSAVRFETGTLELHFSNRVKFVGKNATRKWFGRAHIDLNLSLGQIIKNVIFDEAEPEFQQYAFFNTTVQLRNAFQDEVLNDDKELILLMLKRPLIYIQPIAVDKAILVWLNYKNAYEYWAEKRANLSADLYDKNQQMFEIVPFGQLGNIASSNLSALFLQLTVEDMGICLPLKQITWGPRSAHDFEPRNAVVITLENTIISACNSGSLVSQGKFQELCLRFADDFETTLDDWKPNSTESSIMNLCVVSEGTYEVCSHTIATKRNENAKWFLNVKWQMEGVDINLDINIGKQLSSLGHTLTMLTGFDDDEDNDFESPKSDDGDQIFHADKMKKQELESLPTFLFDTSLNSHMRAFLMEKEMSEQLKIINDLRTLGASSNTIILEERRLQELQAVCYKYFRRDMIQKWKRSSVRRNMLKTNNRSQSFVAASGTQKHQDTEVASGASIAASNETPYRSASARYGNAYTRRAKCSETRRQTSLPSTETFPDFEGNLEHCNENEIGSIPQELPPNSNVMPSKGTYNKQQEPNIDFELNIKVLINSGKCALHTKEIHDEKYVVQSTSMHHKRERSIGNDWNSPTPSRKNRDRSKMKYNTKNNTFFHLTIFHIPGLDVKLFYESKTMNEDSTKTPNTINDVPASLNRKCLNKRASLYAWMTLQSIPEETIISPHILEFLEQTLEPIPLKNDNTLPLNHVNIELLSANYATYSSFPVDVIVYFHMQPSTFRFSCLPVSRVECMLQLPSLDIVFSSKRSTSDLENIGEVSSSSVGGLSVTGCLADFNLYVFHPYGGKKSGLKEAHFSPLTDSERKDSLSVSVEFIKFHLTRCRKLHVGTSKMIDTMPTAVIRFSTIADIGSASFKYDMRRLTEILAFPKAWYRKTIVRRLFLGDISVSRKNQKGFPDLPSPEIIKDIQLQPDERAASPSVKNTQIETNQEWETLVLFVVNFTKLNVQMNMGNVMGNVIWLTRDFRSDGKLSIGSASNKNMHIGIRLGGSSLDAKGGIVGGIFDINDIGTQFHVKEESGKEPYHTIQSKLKAMEMRLDYMGTSILMGRISSFSLDVRDEWKTRNDETIFDLKQSALIFIHGDLLWNQLQIMISKSTTADILKIYFKLEEFFSQQFKSSKRVFYNLESRIGERSQNARKNQKQDYQTGKDHGRGQSNEDARHHRHWQNPLNHAISLIVPTSEAFSMIRECILGGTIILHGNNISLACFNGINFKSKSWALFSLKEPFINFATEAQYIGNEEEIQIVETLAFSLGQNEQNPQTHSMAIVSRVTRNIVFPPQYKSLTEWFLYAFANSEIDEIDKFPTIDRDKDIALNSIDRNRGLSVGNTSRKVFHLNHNREVIFALPSLQFHFKTEHRQKAATPDTKPVVVCSFITEFEDHIFVTVDADAFFFLHDLITSYVKEKEKVIGAQSSRTSSPNWSDLHKNLGTLSSNAAGKKIEDGKPCDPNHVKTDSEDESDISIEHCLRDWRHYECKAWHLEPTVRLLSWAGKSIEPYGVDYILNKLGFSHARITIPKWLQRGFMDPLDNIQALMMLQLLILVKENRSDT